MKKTIAIILSIMLVLGISFQAAAVSAINVKSIKLSSSNITMKVGKTSDLTVTFTPANTTQTKLTYTTGNKIVATVNADGKVTAVGAGITTITAYTLNKSIYAKCTVTILPSTKPKKITLAHGQGEWLWPILDQLTKKYTTLTGNTIELNYVPSATMQDWVKTQFAGDTAPDILWGGLDNTASDALKNKWIIDLKPYFDQVSPYTGKPWKDSFIEGVLTGCIDPILGGAYLGVPLSASAVNIYYNKDIFKSLGIPDKAPQTWSDVINISKKIMSSGKGIIPFSAQNSINWNLDWQRRWMMNDLWDNVVSKLDIIQPDGILEVAEQALGVKTGIIDPADKRMVDYFIYMKEFCKYLNKGFNTASWEFEKLFNEGKSAMTVNGSWYPNQVMLNKINVNYGVGPMPYVDKAISSSSVGVARKLNLGTVAPTFFVTNKTQEENKMDAVIDFLRYMTDPKTGSKDFTEKTLMIPVVKNVEVPAVLKGITDNVGKEQMKIPMWSLQAFTPEEDAKSLVLFQTFYTDEMSAADFTTKIYKPLVLKYLDIAIQQHPEWKISEYEKKVKK